MSSNLNQGVPGGRISDPDGNPTPVWLGWFLNIWTRTGGANPSGPASTLLDTITSVAGSILYRGATAWQGLLAGLQYRVLRMGAEFPEWDLLDGNSFGQQLAAQFFASPTNGAGIPTFRGVAPSDFGIQLVNTFLAGPGSGVSSLPTFRDFVSADLNSIAGQYPGTPTDDDADAGYVGEYDSSQVAIGSPVSLSSGVAKDITNLVLPPGDYDVWGGITTVPAGSTTQSDIKGWINIASATDPSPPNNGCYAELQASIGAGLNQTLSLGTMRVEVAANTTTTIYLSAKVTFATSTLGAAGFLGWRRRR